MRNAHPFLSLDPRDREKDVEVRYHESNLHVFAAERERRKIAQKKQEEQDRRDALIREKQAEAARKEREEMLRTETPAQRDKRIKERP